MSCQKALLPRSSKLLPIFPGGRSHFFLNSWASLVTVHQISAEICPNEIFYFFFFFFFCNSTYSLYSEHWIIQEPVFVLHLFTCQGRIMPCLAELLFFFFSTYLVHILLFVSLAVDFFFHPEWKLIGLLVCFFLFSFFFLIDMRSDRRSIFPLKETTRVLSANYYFLR